MKRKRNWWDGYAGDVHPIFWGMGNTISDLCEKIERTVDESVPMIVRDYMKSGGVLDIGIESNKKTGQSRPTIKMLILSDNCETMGEKKLTLEGWLKERLTVYRHNDDEREVKLLELLLAALREWKEWDREEEEKAADSLRRQSEDEDQTQEQST